MMAAVRLTVPLIVAVISVAILLNVASLSCSEKIPDDELKILISYKESLLADKLEEFQVRSTLKRLGEIFRKYETPEELNSFKNQVQSLNGMVTDFSQPCTSVNRDKYKQLMEEYKEVHSYRVFAEKHGRSYLSKCLHNIFFKTEENVKEISSEHRSDVKLLNFLYQALLSPEKSGSELLKISKPSEHTKELFIALKNFLLTKSSNREVSLYEVYQKHVINPCKSWLPAINEALDIVDDPIEFEIRDVKLTDRVLNYIREGQICEHIQDNDEQIQKDLRLDLNKIVLDADEASSIEPFDGEQCTEESILRNKNRLRKPSLDRTEKDRVELTLSICFFAIGEELQQKVEAISAEHRCELKFLSNHLSSAISGVSERKYRDLAKHKKKVRQTIWEFVASKMLGYTKLDAENSANKHILRPCINWRQATERARRVADYFVCHDSLCDQEWKSNFDESVGQGDICDYIGNEADWSIIIHKAMYEYYLYESTRGSDVDQCSQEPNQLN